MYPSLAQEYGHRISFEPRNKDFDFDMKVENIPFQVKTLFSFKYFPVSTSETANFQKYLKDVAQIKYLYHNNKLNKSYVERKVIDYARNNRISQINKSLEQKAKIVILDGTRTAEGFLLNQSYTDDEIYVKFDDPLKKSIEMNSDQFVNVIYATGAYDYSYRISALAMRLPVKDGRLDESSKGITQLL